MSIVMRSALWLAGLCGVLLSPLASAQVQRSFINLSFETPNLVTAGCRVYIAASQVPGWETTHPAAATENVGTCVVPSGFTQTSPILELWRTPRDNGSGGAVNARSGTQIAELNAVVASRIFQKVCLINGERVDWFFSHRGRGSATVRDVMEMKVGAATTIVRVGTTNSGAFDTPVVSQGTANAPANVPGNATWVDYAGRFIYTGAPGSTNVGFEAIGGTTAGNLLDDIQIAVTPFVEFVQPSSSSPEDTGANLPTLRVNGIVATAFTVSVQITGGTATLGTDYTTPGNGNTLSINVPAGTYDGASAASLFPVPVTIVDDAVAESNETILFAITPPSPTNPPFLLASSTTCGGAVQTTWTYTIDDDDNSLSLGKNSAAPVPVAGNPAQADIVYTIVAENPSTTTAASYSLVDTPGFDADVTVASARFTLNGGTATTLTGGGPWTLQPQWRVLAAGATDTYLVTVRVNVNRGGSIGNDSCSSPSASGNGLHNAVRAVVQGSAGNPNSNFDANSCQRTPTPVWVTLRKLLQGRVAATDQAQVRVFSGGIAAANATTSGAATPATASTGTIVVMSGNTMQFEEAIKTSGTGADRALTGYKPQIACSNAGTPTGGLPSGAGSNVGNRQQWVEFTPAAGADLDCTITNTLSTADLSISKTNNADSVVSGSQVTYAIVASNIGPDAADGAVLTDPTPTGLQDCVLATPACTAAAGATCPTSGSGAGQLSIANLQGAGVLVPSLPSGGNVTVRVTCTVL